jgi:tRNA-splicing ligase RtcB
MLNLADNLVVFGDPIDEGAIEQIKNCMRDERAVRGALMADHHLGYSMPIGGVVAYENAVSPSGVGFDIGCGNKAVQTNLHMFDFFEADDYIAPQEIVNCFMPFMEIIRKTISFGLGRISNDKVDHELFDNPIWSEIEALAPGLKFKAEQQLGTVGSGNHYVDLLYDYDDGTIWIANHFGSRGLGHTIATGFLNLANGNEFKSKLTESEDATVLSTDTDLGQFYIEAMRLAGDYAYAGRDYVADQVLRILGAESTFEVHNHHNFAWNENGLWVVRKGATPLTGEPAFIGGSMGDFSVIVRGKSALQDFQKDHPYAMYNPLDFMFNKEIVDIGAINSAPHGAGRVMSRNKAAGKLRKMWFCPNHNCHDFKPQVEEVGGGKCPFCKIPLGRTRMRDESTAAIDWTTVRKSLYDQGITVLGAGADESPGVYKDLMKVIESHSNIEVMHRLKPLGVIMAGDDTFDPFKD